MGLISMRLKSGSKSVKIVFGIHFDFFKCLSRYGSDYYVVFRSDAPYSVPLSVAGRLLSQIVEVGAVFGGAVMIGLYILIIFEVIIFLV